MQNQYEGKNEPIQRKFFSLNLTEEIWSRNKNRRDLRFNNRNKKLMREMLFWLFRSSGRRRKRE